MVLIQRDYKECLKDFIRGVGLNLGTPEDFDTECETSWVRYLLYDVPAYVDMYLDGHVVVVHNYAELCRKLVARGNVALTVGTLKELIFSTIRRGV